MNLITKEVLDAIMAKQVASKSHEVSMELKANSNAYRSLVRMAVYRRKDREDYSNGNQIMRDISFSNIQELLGKLFLGVHYENGGISNWREHCIGLSSSVWGKNLMDGSNFSLSMPMLDYDGKGISKAVKADVKKLQEHYKLGPAWIYRTKRGFHVYFGTDLIERGVYVDMVINSSCCEGFKRNVANSHEGILRLSAKYTEFDIEFQEIIASPDPARLARKLWPAILAEEIINLGGECKTHFASLFPQWARYTEDMIPWTPKGKGVPKPAVKAPEAAAQLEPVQAEPSDWLTSESTPQDNVPTPPAEQPKYTFMKTAASVEHLKSYVFYDNQNYYYKMPKITSNTSNDY